MRTTLDIDDDLLEALKPVAASQQRSLGQLISELLRTTMRAESNVARKSGFPVFDVADSVALFGPSDVVAALDE